LETKEILGDGDFDGFGICWVLFFLEHPTGLNEEFDLGKPI